MAEYMFKDIVKKNHAEDRFEIASAATSREELGNDIYPPAKKILSEHGVSFGHNVATQVTAKDIEYYDHIVVMEEYNIRNMIRMFGEGVRDKLELLMDYTDRPGDVSDPYYSHDYESVYEDIDEGCRGLFAALMKGESK